jgi:hypothetical protein
LEEYLILSFIILVVHMAHQPVEEHRPGAVLNNESTAAGLNQAPERGPSMVGTVVMPAALLQSDVSPLGGSITSNIFQSDILYPPPSFSFASDQFDTNTQSTGFSLQHALTKHLLPGLASGTPSPSYSQHVFNMPREAKLQVHNLSRSSSQRESSNEAKSSRKSNSIDITDGQTSETISPNPRKRPNTEPVDYPRRRATIAVCPKMFCLKTLIKLLF